MTLAVDLFAGAGGWEIALRSAGVEVVGIEIDPIAVQTQHAAGRNGIIVCGDVRDFQPDDYPATILVASPPCQTYSMAGRGAGRAALDDVLAAVVAMQEDPAHRPTVHDERTTLVLEPLRWALTASKRYDVIALEQVPTVLPVWEAIAYVLRRNGYDVVTGYARAETFGVPQTRKRAILIARRDGRVQLPTPTHSRHYPREPDRLDPLVLPFVTMGDALGWSASLRIGNQDGATVRRSDQPAPTIAFGNAWDYAQWLNDDVNGNPRIRDQSGTLIDLLWPERRPATVIAGRDLVQHPGETRNRHNTSTKTRNDGIRITTMEAAVLQGFPADYPFAGSLSDQYRQIGNAIPPAMATAILEAGGVQSKQIPARRYVRETLWDVEQEDAAAIRVADCIVAPVSTSDVEEFSQRYHYAQTGGSALWRWGLWHGTTLLGIVAYNNPTRNVQASLFGDEHVEHVWHMGRLALAEHAPHNSESRLIAGSIREIRKTHPEVWAIVTYAATSAGHVGYVYQATNALYTGTGGDPFYFVDRDGSRHSTYLSGYVSLERGASMGWTRHEDTAKHRYVYLLGSKTQRAQLRKMLRLPVLPYPKGDAMPVLETPLETLASRKPLVVVVDAKPAPQGSKRHVGGGILIESSRNVKPFREAVAKATQLARADLPTFDDAVAVSMTFTLPRPKSHYRRTTKSGVVTMRLREDAPAAPATRPDLDKLTRAVLDALTTGGAYGDDGLVVRLDAEKCYPNGALDALDDPGVLIVVQAAS